MPLAPWVGLGQTVVVTVTVLIGSVRVSVTVTIATVLVRVVGRGVVVVRWVIVATVLVCVREAVGAGM